MQLDYYCHELLNMGTGPTLPIDLIELSTKINTKI